MNINIKLVKRNSMGIIDEILQNYFIDPATNPAVQGYNAVNTIVYVSILLAMAFLVVFPFLDRKGIKFSKEFAVSLLPYIFLGSSLRLLVSDNCNAAWGICFQKALNPLESGFWFFTPGVWITTFAVTIVGLFTAKKVSGKNFEKVFGAIGLLFLLPVLVFDFLHFSRLAVFFGTLMLAIGIGLAVKIIVDRFTKTRLLKDRMNFLAMQGQVMDAVPTTIATTFFGFSEQHPLSAGILSINPALFLIVKTGLVLAILHFADKDIQNENQKGFFKTFLTIIGFATGTASLLKLGI